MSSRVRLSNTSPRQSNGIGISTGFTCINLGNAQGFGTDFAQELSSSAQDWRLLLQFDSDDELQKMWGDSGMLYFWIQESKAQHNQFDDVWVILQST